MIRRGNEDCFMVADLSTGNVGLTPEVSTHRCGDLGSLLIVSDGMGGAVAGEIASDLSVKTIREELARTSHVMSVSDRLRQAVESANRAVWQKTQENPQLAGMGATVTAVLCHGGRAYVAQVGDSRAYLVRKNRIKQLTKDQSLVQLLMDAKAIRPEQAGQIPNNVILQALGTRPEIVVAMTSVDLCSGDVMLLCSDGLSNKISAEEMRDIVVRAGADLVSGCRHLIEMANRRGGEDNITALLAAFDGSSLSEASEARSITGSLHELTSNDLLRIGGAQLDYFHDPAADLPPAAAPDVGAVLDDLGVTLVSTQPNPPVDGGAKPITQVAIPVVQKQQRAPEPDPEPPVLHTPAPPSQAAAPPAAAARPAGSNPAQFLLVAGALLAALVILMALGLAVYWYSTTGN
jgi:serine/threonine protein phosphatase PrpC